MTITAGDVAELVERFPEINPSNYDHDDVCALNAWGCEAHDALTALAGERDELRKALDERFEQYRNARDALFQFNYPPDPKLLREIANEIDCGNDCAHGYTEWDTNAHVCSRSESKEGCASEKAWCLRQFADAVDTRASLPKGE
jgi:hypothetical protein